MNLKVDVWECSEGMKPDHIGKVWYVMNMDHISYKFKICISRMIIHLWKRIVFSNMIFRILRGYFHARVDQNNTSWKKVKFSSISVNFYWHKCIFQ